MSVIGDQLNREKQVSTSEATTKTARIRVEQHKQENNKYHEL